MSKYINKKINTPPRKQAGDFLIEAMIGVMLMGIVGAGVTFVTSRVSVSQQNMAMQEIAIGKMRGMLLANGTSIDLCSQTPYVYLPNGETLRIQVSGCGATATANVGGVEIPSIQAPIVLAVNSPSLGEIRVGGHESAVSEDQEDSDPYQDDNRDDDDDRDRDDDDDRDRDDDDDD